MFRFDCFAKMGKSCGKEIRNSLIQPYGSHVPQKKRNLAWDSSDPR